MATFTELVSRDIPVLVDFHATWCGPCKMMEPVITRLKENFGSRIAIIKIDIDKNQALAGQLGVRGVPTFMLYKNGKVVWRESGARPFHELETVINSNI